MATATTTTSPGTPSSPYLELPAATWGTRQVHVHFAATLVEPSPRAASPSKRLTSPGGSPASSVPTLPAIRQARSPTPATKSRSPARNVSPQPLRSAMFNPYVSRRASMEDVPQRRTGSSSDVTRALGRSQSDAVISVKQGPLCRTPSPSPPKRRELSPLPPMKTSPSASPKVLEPTSRGLARTPSPSPSTAAGSPTLSRRNSVSPLPPMRTSPTVSTTKTLDQPPSMPPDLTDHFCRLQSTAPAQYTRTAEQIRAMLTMLEKNSTFSGEELIWLWKVFATGAEMMEGWCIVSPPRLAVALVNGGLVTSMLDNLVKQLFCTFDSDNNGKVTFEEFVLGMAVFYSKCTRPAGVTKFMFRLFDVDGDGVISSKEVFLLLRALLNNASRILVAHKSAAPAAYFNDEQLKRVTKFIMEQADNEVRDGKVTKSEFDKWSQESNVLRSFINAFISPNFFVQEFTKWLSTQFASFAWTASTSASPSSSSAK